MNTHRAGSGDTLAIFFCTVPAKVAEARELDTLCRQSCRNKALISKVAETKELAAAAD
jgi:hypothetical protein